MTEQTHTQSIEACSEKTVPSNLIQDRLRTKLKKYLEELKKKKKSTFPSIKFTTGIQSEIANKHKCMMHSKKKNYLTKLVGKDIRTSVIKISIQRRRKKEE